MMKQEGLKWCSILRSPAFYECNKQVSEDGLQGYYFFSNFLTENIASNKGLHQKNMSMNKKKYIKKTFYRKFSIFTTEENSVYCMDVFS